MCGRRSPGVLQHARRRRGQCLRLRHVEHVNRLDAPDCAGVIRVRGDDVDPHLALHHHAARGVAQRRDETHGAVPGTNRLSLHFPREQVVRGL
jgi:hypothetical protein